MFQPALNLIRKECSGPVALNLVANISRYHRIRVSPGYRQAIAGRLIEVKGKTKILEPESGAWWIRDCFAASAPNEMLGYSPANPGSKEFHYRKLKNQKQFTRAEGASKLVRIKGVTNYY
jgi:hypothetical protein